jgi:hypothetical protein
MYLIGDPKHYRVELKNLSGESPILPTQWMLILLFNHQTFSHNKYSLYTLEQVR